MPSDPPNQPGSSAENPVREATDRLAARRRRSDAELNYGRLIDAAVSLLQTPLRKSNRLPRSPDSPAPPSTAISRAARTF
jgi:hypothetical protein